MNEHLKKSMKSIVITQITILGNYPRNLKCNQLKIRLGQKQIRQNFQFVSACAILIHSMLIYPQ